MFSRSRVSSGRYLLSVENTGLFGRVNGERVPENDFPVPDIGDHALDDPLAKEPFGLSNGRNLQGVQPKEA